MKYTIELSGPTIAALGVKRESVSQCVEIRDACRATIAKHDLGPDGEPMPLTVNGEPLIHVSHGSLLLNETNSPVSAAWLIEFATPAELARIRKALGVEDPTKRTCATCKWFKNPSCTCVSYCSSTLDKWDAKPRKGKG